MLRSVKYGITAPSWPAWSPRRRSGPPSTSPCSSSSTASTSTVQHHGRQTSPRSCRPRLPRHRHDLVAPSADGSVVTTARASSCAAAGCCTSTSTATAPMVWTTAPTVSERARPARATQHRDFVSVSRARRLPLRADRHRDPHPATRDRRARRTHRAGDHDRRHRRRAARRSSGRRRRRRSSQPRPPNADLHGRDEVIRVQRVGQAAGHSDRRRCRTRPSKLRDTDALPRARRRVVHPGRSGKATRDVLGRVRRRQAGRAHQDPDRDALQAAPRVLAIGTKRIVQMGGVADSGTTTRSAAVSAPAAPSAPTPSAGSAKAIARQLLAKRGWGSDQYSCLVTMWNRESGWRVARREPERRVRHPAGAARLQDGLGRRRLADNAETQIKWGLGYIRSRYGTPCGAWSLLAGARRLVLHHRSAG